MSDLKQAELMGFKLAGGVMWCAEHFGIADECSSDADRCDMAEDDDFCDLRDLFYGPAS